MPDKEKDTEMRFFYMPHYLGGFQLLERQPGSPKLEQIGGMRNENFAEEYCKFKNLKDSVARKKQEETKE